MGEHEHTSRVGVPSVTGECRPLLRLPHCVVTVRPPLPRWMTPGLAVMVGLVALIAATGRTSRLLSAILLALIAVVWLGVWALYRPWRLSTDGGLVAHVSGGPKMVRRLLRHEPEQRLDLTEVGVVEVRQGKIAFGLRTGGLIVVPDRLFVLDLRIRSTLKDVLTNSDVLFLSAEARAFVYIESIGLG